MNRKLTPTEHKELYESKKRLRALAGLAPLSESYYHIEGSRDNPLVEEEPEFCRDEARKVLEKFKAKVNRTLDVAFNNILEEIKNMPEACDPSFIEMAINEEFDMICKESGIFCGRIPLK